MSTLAIRPLNSSLQAIAIEQLNEEPEKIHEAIEAFRQWLKKSPHLKARSDDQFLVMFLRGCKYSLERAKTKFDMYYTLRTHVPEIFSDRDPNDARLQEILKLSASFPLPETETPGSPRLFFYRPGAFDPTKYTIQEFIKVTTMINEIMMNEDDNMIVAGQVVIIDQANITLAHMTQMSMTLLKKMTMMGQEGSPIRQKGVHYINTPKAIEKFFNFFKSFINEKMQSRLFVHSSLESLYKVIPQKLMPTEYGGEAGSVKSLSDACEKKVLAYRDYFLEESKYGVDEKKRPGRPKNSDSLFGVDGTFRQLQFD